MALMIPHLKPSELRTQFEGNVDKADMILEALTSSYKHAINTLEASGESK